MEHTDKNYFKRASVITFFLIHSFYDYEYDCLFNKVLPIFFFEDNVYEKLVGPFYGSAELCLLVPPKMQ